MNLLQAVYSHKYDAALNRAEYIPPPRQSIIPPYLQSAQKWKIKCYLLLRLISCLLGED